MRVIAAVVVAAALGVGGGFLLDEKQEEDRAGPRSLRSWNTCVNRGVGFRISYPAGWYTHHPAPEVACFFFDPRTFEYPPDDDVRPTALQVRPGGTFDEALDAATDPRVVEIIEREDLELAGRRAVRVETRTRSGGAYGAGTLTYAYILDREPRAFVVRTASAAEIDYEPWKRIVDRAVETMEFTRRSLPTVEGGAVVPPQAGLPAAVARKRAQIWLAARAEDPVEVARLVDGTGFQYTFGSPVRGGPAVYWEGLDETTRERPIQTLRAILELPYVYVRRSRIYVWPYAFTRKASTLSLDERKRLRDTLGEEALKVYEVLGTYVGYRAGIDERGNWVFYVAGD